MATEQSYAVFGLAEHELRSELEGELVRAMRQKARRRRCTRSPTALPRILELDHQRMAAQLERAGVWLQQRSRIRTPDEAVADQVESGSQCLQLAAFLRGCRAQPRVVVERSLAIELDDDRCPGSRRSSRRSRSGGARRGGEVSLALGGEH
jgi:hypothetical protein